MWCNGNVMHHCTFGLFTSWLLFSGDNQAKIYKHREDQQRHKHSTERELIWNEKTSQQTLYIPFM